MKTLVFVFTAMMLSVPGWILLGWSNNTECIMEGEAEDLRRGRWSLVALPSSACPYTPAWMKTQGKQAVLKIARTIKIHSMWHDILVSTKSGCCVLPCVPVQDWQTCATTHKYYHNNFYANKQNSDVQTDKQCRCAVFTFEVLCTVVIFII
jgi:hypothetical protein